VRRAAGSLAALALLAPGCGTSGDDPGLTGKAPSASAGTPLVRALRSVASVPESRSALRWSDTRRLRGLGAGWRRLAVGRSAPGTGAATVPRAAAVDPLAATSAVAIGRSPRTGVRLDGVGADPAAVRRRLRAAGGRPLASAGAGPALTALPGATRVGSANGAVAAGASAPIVLALLEPGGDRLDRAPGVREIAGCLGDAVAARIEAGATLDAPRAGVTRFGAAVAPPPAAGAGPAERLCVRAATPAAARRIAARLRAVDFSGGVGGHGVVTPAPGLVRLDLDLEPRGAPGLLFGLLDNGAVAEWVGGQRGAAPPGSGP
jgi:hypothetical protein